MAKQTVTVSAIQMASKKQSFDEFKQAVKNSINKAVKQQSQIIVFPEDNTLNMIADSQFTKDDLTSLSKYVEPYSHFIGRLAKENDLLIIGGSIPYQYDDKLYNTTVIGLPSGKTVLHNKIYLTPWEQQAGYTGTGSRITSFKTDWGNIAVLVCYTSEFPNVSYLLTKFNPDLILIPSYTDDIYGLSRVKNAAQMRAIENFSYVVLTGMVSNLSFKKLGNREVGQAVFATPQEQGFPLGFLTKGKFNQTDMITQTLDISKLKQTEKHSHANAGEQIRKHPKKLSIDIYSIDL